ncbi:hypothetical protein GJ744_006496 [Endocarpon pusillum]|uniref:Uncharacterized protein n=1 Tax=Endocarpon pusillum TaxID=364733 RepID=A0A8H7E967_9EURO|nr:hypothetical protein GJ744_006496 [Endocarpon pusillum]
MTVNSISPETQAHLPPNKRQQSTLHFFRLASLPFPLSPTTDFRRVPISIDCRRGSWGNPQQSPFVQRGMHSERPFGRLPFD